VTQSERSALYHEHGELVEMMFLGSATLESNRRLSEVRAELDKLHIAEMFPDAGPGELSLEERH
jgi:hypothetical protein